MSAALILHGMPFLKGVIQSLAADMANVVVCILHHTKVCFITRRRQPRRCSWLHAASTLVCCASWLNPKSVQCPFHLTCCNYINDQVKATRGRVFFVQRQTAQGQLISEQSWHPYHCALIALTHCLRSDSHMKQPHALVCAVSTVPDNVRFMQTHQVTSPAKDFLTSLRRYPSMRSEVEVSMRGLRAALGNVYRAAHGVCERLVKLKVSSRCIFVQRCTLLT